MEGNIEEDRNLNVDNDWNLFAPKSARGLRVDYPELASYEEFRAVSRVELHFVWLYACKASPLFNSRLKGRDLIVTCMQRAKFVVNDPEKREKIISGDLGAKIQKAVDTMYLFEPSIRIKSKKLAIKQLADIEKMTSLKLDAEGNHGSFLDKEGGVDMNKKKAYMSMIITANEKIDGMMEKAEKGFGVTKSSSKNSDKNKEGSGNSFAESFHENN